MPTHPPRRRRSSGTTDVFAGSGGAVVLAPDVLSTALAVRGGTCARALERVVTRDMALILTGPLLRVTLARLVRLFGYEREAVCHAAVLLKGLSAWVDVLDEPGIARGSDVVRHIGEAMVYRNTAKLVVGQATPFFGRRLHSDDVVRGEPYWFASLSAVDVRDFVGQRPIRPLAVDEPARRG